jgi:hypothetical protein
MVEMLGLVPPVPTARMYRARKKTPSCALIACCTQLGSTVLAPHLGGRGTHVSRERESTTQSPDPSAGLANMGGVTATTLAPFTLTPTRRTWYEWMRARAAARHSRREQARTGAARMSGRRHDGAADEWTQA